MQAGLPKLPQELIDYIIDYLHNDKQALSCCSTVCSSWLAPSSFHLFSILTVHLRYYPFQDEFRPDPCAELAILFRLFLKSKRLSRYVQDLRVECRNFGSPIWSFDVEMLGELLGSFAGLRSVSLQGLNLCHSDTRSGHSSESSTKSTIAQLVVEASRFSGDSLPALLRLFSHIDELKFVHILSIDPSTLPDVALAISELSVASIWHAACHRSQLISLIPPLNSNLSTEKRRVHFTNILLDDMLAVDEYLAAFGPVIEHLQIDLPDRWFSWDPPETDIEKLFRHVNLPSLAICTSLRSLHITVPLKMSPAALHVNQCLWTRLIDLLLTLPSPSCGFSSLSIPPSEPLSTTSFASDSASRSDSHSTGTALPGSSPDSIHRVHIAFGNPRWAALAEVPYVLGVVHTLDWQRLDEVIAHLELDSPRKSFGILHELEDSDRKVLEISIGCRTSRKRDVERTVLGRVSARAKRVLQFD